MIYEWNRDVFVTLSEQPVLGSLCGEIGKGAGPHVTFYRLRWEVPAETIGLGVRWVPFANGGGFSPFRREDRILLDWEDSGKRVKVYICEKYPYLKGNTAWNIQLEGFYGKSGITYGKKTTNFSAQLLPPGCIFSFEGIGIFPRYHEDTYWLLAYLNSSFCSWFLNSTCGLHKNPPYLRRLPVPEFAAADRQRLAEIAKAGWRDNAQAMRQDELSSVFVSPNLSNKRDKLEAGLVQSELVELAARLSEHLRAH